MAEGCVSLCTGFEDLIGRAALKRVAPQQDPDALRLPIKEYVVNNLDDLTRDPLASAVFERIVFLRFDNNAKSFVPHRTEEIKRDVKELYAELYFANTPTTLCDKVAFLAGSHLAIHQLLYQQLSGLREEIHKTPDYFND